MTSPKKSSTKQSFEDRLRFVKHHGHAIYLIDFSHCAEKEMLLLLDMIRADVARHEPASLLTLADFTGAHGIDERRELLREVFGPGRAELITQRSEARDLQRPGRSHPANHQVVHRGVQPVERVAEFGDFVHGGPHIA